MYIDSPFNYERRQSRPLRIGRLTLGGNAPIRIQTMANTDTNDIAASVAQAERIAAVGAELLRYTTQGIQQVQNLGKIKQRLRDADCKIPLVADVHFNPKVALEAAKTVEKVRINPGNFVAGMQSDYSEADFAAELDEIHQKLTPLIALCREHGTALRIGVNHGSLSPRIMNRFGDTPTGLAASCMEFLTICHAEGFDDIVLSVKASNTLVMVQAVRLLVEQMNAADMHYPLHLGVTEAGNGEDGRIKSAVGIGALLADGLGDTIRVSLSEEPEREVPVARFLADYIAKRSGHHPISGALSSDFSPYNYTRRKTRSAGRIGGAFVPVVVATEAADFGELQPDYYLNSLPVKAIELTYDALTPATIAQLRDEKQAVILLRSAHRNPIGEMKAFFHRLMLEKIDLPVVIAFDYETSDIEQLQIMAGADFGALLLDGFGDGICLSVRNSTLSAEAVNSVAFGVLQASRVRMSRTEYIACPSCGRTLFDLQTTLAKIQQATAHLKNLKIGVMGCIVNGPGEMADADYGYVGAGKGRVSLYKGKRCIEKNIPEGDAIDHLMRAIDYFTEHPEAENYPDIEKE